MVDATLVHHRDPPRRKPLLSVTDRVINAVEVARTHCTTQLVQRLGPQHPTRRPRGRLLGHARQRRTSHGVLHRDSEPALQPTRLQVLGDVDLSADRGSDGIIGCERHRIDIMQDTRANRAEMVDR